MSGPPAIFVGTAINLRIRALGCLVVAAVLDLLRRPGASKLKARAVHLEAEAARWEEWPPSDDHPGLVPTEDSQR